MRLDTAVILAGGAGTRLKPLTDNIPKGMIEIHGKPLLEWVIDWLRDMNVKNIVLGVAYLKEQIIDYFGDGKSFGVNVKYSVHSVDGGTSEGFRLAIERFVDEDVFFAMNGDQISDLNLNNLADFHSKNSSIATVAVSNPRCPFGHITMNDEKDVTGFIEKPLCPHALCSTGMYVFNHAILDYLPERGDVEKTTFPVLTKLGKLKSYPFNGFFITINTFKDLIEAEEELRRRYG